MLRLTLNVQKRSPYLQMTSQINTHITKNTQKIQKKPMQKIVHIAHPKPDHLTILGVKVVTVLAV